MSVLLFSLSVSELWAIERSWDRARSAAQDEGRVYMAISTRGFFNI